ncbi:carbohydrate ABC transporter permease [Microbacterium oxydans]|uniref:carbohydrate ABC transporter permease n=1 Tax=Microbacterium oxydans TaxID=82380 RepID=UPI00226B9A8F|nr:sugar ABC transporter permease [Microbacterium oxydans]WAA66234.1 sugar ABC transporter permease [Microbacterium oxydans]
MSVLSDEKLAPAAVAPSRAAGRRPSRRPRAPYAFVLPAALLFLAFYLIPLGYAIYLSFRGAKVSGGGGYGTREETWVGLENYANVLTDPELLASLVRLLQYGLITVPITLGGALLIALLLDAPRARFVTASRTAIFAPYAVPGIIASIMWGFLFLPSTSPLNAILKSLGLPTLNLLDSSWVIGSLANIAIWGALGFNMIILYTALRSVPMEIYDSARVDGCSEWQIAWRIKIPLIAPSLVLTSLFSLIATLQVYSEPTTLRPLTSAITSTFFPLMKVYRDAFTNDQINAAAAMAVVITVGTLVASLGLLRLVQGKTNGDER